MFSKGKKKAGGAGASPEDSKATGLPAGLETGGSSARREPSGVPSIISADLTIEGNLVSHGDLQIDGTVQGDIWSRTLTLGEDGRIEGAIEAETVRLCGEVQGQVKAATVVVTKTAKVQGDILHDSLAIEAGAFIDGHCRRDLVATAGVPLLDQTPLDGKTADGKPAEGKPAGSSTAGATLAGAAATAPVSNGRVSTDRSDGETKPTF